MTVIVLETVTTIATTIVAETTIDLVIVTVTFTFYSGSNVFSDTDSNNGSNSDSNSGNESDGVIGSDGRDTMTMTVSVTKAWQLQ